MSPNNPGIVIVIDFGNNSLNFFQYELVLCSKIGTFFKLLYFLFQNPAPFVLIIQINDLVHQMVFIKIQPQTIDKSLMEHKIIRCKPIIGFAALHNITKTVLTINGQNIKVMVTNPNVCLS